MIKSDALADSVSINAFKTNNTAVWIKREDLNKYIIYFPILIN